jgi:CheY-like chemotaxis protein
MRHTPLRILYVEDNPLVREVTCELMAQPTREILATSSAEEALQAFKPDAFDVVVTDISLPGMSGLDMARHILRTAPSMAIIIATGYRLGVDPKSIGPNVRVIEKPFDSPAIDSLLDELCPPIGPD